MVMVVYHQPSWRHRQGPILEERGHLAGHRLRPSRSHMARRLRQTLEQGGRDAVLRAAGIHLEMPGIGENPWKSPLFGRLKLLKIGG